MIPTIWLISLKFKTNFKRANYGNSEFKSSGRQHTARAMMRLLDKDVREKMGQQSRKLCEEKYDVHSVNHDILSALKII